MRPAIVLSLWAATTVAGFWWYDGRYRLPVPAQPAEKPSIGTSLVEPGAKATLLAFYSPSCACSRFAVAHIRKLEHDYKAAGLNVLVVIEDGDEGPDGLKSLVDAQGKIARAFGVPAAPGAVVLDAKGKIVYTGGFNVARFCDDSKTAFAQAAIVATLADKSPAISHGEFYGCAMPARS